MRKAELVCAICLALLSLFIMWKSGEGPSWDPDAARFDNIWFDAEEGEAGSGLWPFWLSAIMLVSCIWTIVNWVRRETPASRSEAVFLDGYGWRMLLLVGGGVLAFIGLIQIVGAYFAMAIFFTYYLYFLGRHSVLRTATVALVFPIGSFFFFEVGMRILLPKGYSEPLFIPLYDIFL